MREQDRQALLTAAIKRTDKRLEIFKEHNSGIPEKNLMREFAQNEGVYWEDLETIINAAKDQLDQYREDINADTHSALDALERLLSYTNGLGDGAAYTIRAALTAPDVNADIQEWLKTLDYQRDLALIWMVAKGSKDYDETIGDRIERVQQLILEQKKALTEQLTKTDDNVSCPNTANAGDINTELLEALKEAWSVVSSINYGKNHVIKRSDGDVLYGQTGEWCMWALKEVLPKMEQAIARAEQKGK